MIFCFHEWHVCVCVCIQRNSVNVMWHPTNRSLAYQFWVRTVWNLGNVQDHVQSQGEKCQMTWWKCWILSIERFLKKENFFWRLYPGLDFDQRKYQRQFHGFCLPCTVTSPFFQDYCLCPVRESDTGNHTEWLAFEGTSRDQLIQLSCSSRAT